MKTFIHYKIGSLMMLFVGLFLSCSKTEDLGSFVPKDPNMSFNSDMIEINKEGGEFTVAVESNLPWRAKANADWITLSAENSLGDGDIVFSVGRNRTVDQRIGEIKVWITKDYEKTIRVIQAPADLSDLVTHYYVKVSGSADNSGLSWSEATSLEKALDEVIPGDVIHIAAGTYTPTKTITGGSASNPGDVTFEIHSNIHIIGGYPADAGEGATSDPATNETILSGNTPTGKAFHTVAITAPVVANQKVILEGLSIKYGHAATSGTGNIMLNGAPYHRFYGGGLIVAKSVVDIIDCEISDNSTDFAAAGVFVFSEAQVHFIRSVVKNNNNTRNGGNGGGIYNEGATVILENSAVTGNTISGVGAGIYAFSSTQPTYTYVYNSTIANNNNDAAGLSQTRRGGGFYGRERSVSVIVNSTFYENTGGNGAGISLYGTAAAPSRMDIINSTVTRNNGLTNGGGIEFTANTTMNVHNSIVSGNTAPNGPDVFEGGAASFAYSVKGAQILNESGGVIVGQSFDFESMLGSLTDNGGYTPTALLSAGSPAATLGMSVGQLENLAQTFNPVIPQELITKDQTGKSRNGKTAMGATIP